MRMPSPRQINRLLILPALVAVAIIVAAQGRGFDLRAVGQDAPAASVVVDAFPDLAGEGAYWPDCPGCDGAFRAGDALLAEEDPLPALQVRLVDDSGRDRLLTTRAMSEGRQQAIFELDAVQVVTLSLVSVPEGWAACPERRDELVLGAADFEDGQARVEFALSPTCRPPGTAVTAASLARDDEPAEPQLAEQGDAALRVDGEGADVAEGAAAEDEDDTDRHDGPTDAVSEEAVYRAEDDANVAAETIGSLAGVVFVDADRDGRRAADEPGLPDVQVFLDAADDTVTAVTDAEGSFVFEGLRGTGYDVSLAVPGGFEPVVGDRYARLAVNGRALEGVDFALALAAVQDDDVDAVGSGETDVVMKTDGAAQDCDCDDPAALVAGQDGWMPWGGLPSTGLSGVGLRSSGGLAGVALLAGLLGMVGLALERRRRPGRGA